MNKCHTTYLIAKSHDHKIVRKPETSLVAVPRKIKDQSCVVKAFKCFAKTYPVRLSTIYIWFDYHPISVSASCNIFQCPNTIRFNKVQKRNVGIDRRIPASQPCTMPLFPQCQPTWRHISPYDINHS